MKGTILYSTWGYNMTLNDYCVVLEETPKTVKCQMLTMSVSNDNGRGDGKSEPTQTMVGTPFRLRKKGDWFVGSYPFIPEREDSKRFGHFYVWDGKPNYYNTWD